MACLYIAYQGSSVPLNISLNHVHIAYFSVICVFIVIRKIIKLFCVLYNLWMLIEISNPYNRK